MGHPVPQVTANVFAVSPATGRLEGPWPYGNRPGIFAGPVRQGQQSSANVVASSGNASLLFDGSFAGYTATSNWATMQSQFFAHGWHYFDGTDGRMSIEADPLDASQMCFAMWYYEDGNGHALAWNTDQSHANPTSRPTELYVEWYEYRPSDFDFNASKDFRLGVIPQPWYINNHDHDADRIDVYGGFGGSPGGVSSPNDAAGGNIQGNGFPQPVGDANTILLASGEFLTRGVWHKIGQYWKMNTPNNFDGALKIFVDDTQIASKTDVKYSKDGVAQAVIDGFQMGMEATNGGAGAAFNPQRKRFVKRIKIYSALP